ncbi:hypothetical protein VNI00_014554 [Paramarasmius palmivorus]|uniref:NADP-dependent oxidoreductase domain-containing protein n=1 Tax=Paramarasmius palmivorus TaxID=297713 RepID=A0AAW0BTJ9_9AGAR
MSGSSGLRVSVPILGAMGFGTPEWQPWVLDEEKSIEVLKASWDRGINTIDTGNAYSNGESERIIGKFIKKYNIPRSQLIILTKVYSIVAEEPSTQGWFPVHFEHERRYVNQGGLSRAASLIKSTGVSNVSRRQETMKALHDLVQSGKVRYIGGSSMRAWQFAHLNEVAAKNGWTKEDEREMHAYCRFNGIGIIPWGPLHGGALARPVGVVTTRAEAYKNTPLAFNASEAERTIISRVEELSKKHGVPMATIALSWVAAKVASPIVGTTSVKRLDDNIPNPNLKLSEEEVKYLEEP